MQRASSATPDIVEEYFKKAEKLMNDLAFVVHEDKDRRVWNCDETGIPTAVAFKFLLARRGSKWVHETGGGTGREMMIMMGCGSAAGERLPSMIVYKGKHLYRTWTINSPPGAFYSTSEPGWMEKHNFLHWFKNCFLPLLMIFCRRGQLYCF